MGLRHSVAIILVLAVSAIIPARGEQPATKPTVPALTVGSPPPQSFMARGIIRFAADAGWAFHVATDGQKQVCAMYDPADGTPLFFSDGQQTLVYDLENSRVVRVPVSRGFIRLDWDAQDERPLGFTFGVKYNTDPKNLSESNSWFRIDRFVDSTPTFKRSVAQDDTELFTAERKGGSSEALQRAPSDASWFRFTSISGGEPPSKLELHVTAIDGRLPTSALAFPDPKRFPADVHLTDLDQQLLPTFVAFLRDGRAWTAKLALAGGPPGFADKAMPKADWAQLRERDASLGAAYRKALAAQGVEFPTYLKASTTQPTR